MPAIRKDVAQEKALTEITNALATISTLNVILEDGYDKPIVINFDTGESGRNKYVKLTISAKENEREHAALVKMAAQQKAKLVKTINNKSAKFNISLSKEDEAIIRKTGASKKKAAATEEPDGAEEEMSLGTDAEEQGAVGQTSMPNFGDGPEEEIDPYNDGEPADPEGLF